MAIAVTSGLGVGAVLPVIQLWYDEGLSPFSHHFARMLAVTLAVGAGGAGLAFLANRLPDELALAATLALVLGATWTACRFALPLEDRLALGKTGRALRLA